MAGMNCLAHPVRLSLWMWLCAGSGPRYAGALACLTDTVKREGFRALYRGMALPLAGTVVETATLFLTNGALKRALRERGHIAAGEELPIPMVLVAGAGTGLFVSFVLTPIELVKCRMQVSGAHGPGGHVYRGPLDCLAQSVAREGLGVVYRGHAATMLREIPGTAAWFGAYEMFARAMTPPGVSRDALPASTIIASGALGGMAYWTIMYPCDTVKSAMQISDGPIATTVVSWPHPDPPQAQSGTAGAGGGGVRASAVGVAAGSNVAKVAAVAGAVATPAPALALSGAVRRVTMAAAAVGVNPASVTSSGSTAALSTSTSGGTRAGPLPSLRPTFMSTFRAVYRSGGAAALYAGFLPTLLRAAPSNAAIFVGYEWAKGHLQPVLLA